MLRFILYTFWGVVLISMSVLTASACQLMVPYNPDAADVIFEGTAIDINVTYDKPFNVLKPFERRWAASSTVTFQVTKIVRGKYEGDTINAVFPFNWFGGPPTRMSELTSGYNKKATVGVTFKGALLNQSKIPASTPKASTAYVLGGICSDTFFNPHQRTQKDG